MIFLKIAAFLIFIIFSVFNLWIYKRTKVEGALTLAISFTLGTFAALLWIITDNVWIFLILEIFSTILLGKGIGEISLTERITGISLLERCLEGIPMESIQYKPLKSKSIIIEIILMIIVNVLLILFFFYLWKDYGILLEILWIILLGSGMIIGYDILRTKKHG